MDEKRRVLSIDLETFSDIDLSSCGVYRYVEGDFHILLFAYAFDDEDVRVVDMPAEKNCLRKSRTPFSMKPSSRQRGTHSSNVHVCPGILVPSFLQIPGSARWSGRHPYRFR